MFFSRRVSFRLTRFLCSVGYLAFHFRVHQKLWTILQLSVVSMMHTWRRVRRYWIYQCYALVWHFPETSGLCYSALCASFSRDVQFLLVRGPISWNFFLNFLPNSLKHTQACFGLGCVKKKRKEKCSHTYPAHLLDCRLFFCLCFFLSSACTSQFLTHLNWNMYIWWDMVYSDFRCLSESSASDRNWFVVLSYQYRE